jgi:hypothetical protein
VAYRTVVIPNEVMLVVVSLNCPPAMFTVVPDPATATFDAEQNDILAAAGVASATKMPPNAPLVEPVTAPKIMWDADVLATA